jgi:hypothetical protein
MTISYSASKDFIVLQKLVLQKLGIGRRLETILEGKYVTWYGISLGAQVVFMNFSGHLAHATVTLCCPDFCNTQASS